MEKNYFDLSGFVEILTPEDLLKFENFSHLCTSSASLARIFATYDFGDGRIECSHLQCVRRKHGKGCLVGLTDGSITNWGHDCAERETGQDFITLRAQTQNSEYLFRSKRLLNNFIRDAENLDRELADIDAQQWGWQWFQACRQSFADRIPKPLEGELRARSVRGDGQVNLMRRRSKQEVDSLAAQFPDSPRSTFEYAEDQSITIAGISSIAPHKADAVLRLRRELETLCSVDKSNWPPGSVDSQLRRCQAIPNEVLHFKHVLAEARTFFKRDNINLLRHLRTFVDQRFFDTYAWDEVHCKFTATKKLDKRAA